MIYILTSTSTILRAEVRPQESRKGDSNVKAVLNLKLKSTLTKESFSEQLGYLQTSAIAAYISLNKLDQRTRFRSSVYLEACNNQAFNFTQGSSSSGLGYALACFDAWWRLALNRNSEFNAPVFATGEILTSGQINPIAHIHEKITSLCYYIEENKDSISTFYFCYPTENDKEITTQLKEQITSLGGVLIPSESLQETLATILGESYDGAPLGRWLPFKGLQSFEYEDSVRFFGRDKDVDRIASDIKNNSGLLIVSGASGTGKSSLIKAGLIPKLEKESGILYWAVSTPTALTNTQGILSFTVEAISQAWNIPNEKLDEILLLFNQSVESGIAYIKNYLNENSINCLIYIDQFEEVFIQNEKEVNQITNELGIIDSLVKSLASVNVVLAIRNEYLGRLLDSQALRSPIVSNVASQLTSQEWQSIVNEQALFSGITFEKNDDGDQSLDELIVDEALQTPFALPMVSFLLEQLYFKSSEEKRLSTILRYQHFKELGGLNGAIAHRASKVIEENNFSEDVLSKFFDFFVGINPDGLPFARHVSLSVIEVNDKALYDLVIAFNDSNLVLNVTTNIDGPKVKLAHDSLFSNWTALSQWIEKSKEYLFWRYSIDGSFTRWQKSVKNQNAYYIKDDQLLKEGKSFQKRSLILDNKVSNYLNLSLKYRTKNRFSFFFIFVILPVIIYGGYQWDKNRIKSYYYSALGEKWSVPYGINQLTGEQVSHRTTSYRLDYQDGVLQKLAHVNSYNTLVVDNSRNNAAIWEYNYLKDGTLESVAEKDAANKVLKVTNYKFNNNSQAIAEFNVKFGKILFNQVSKNLENLPFFKHNESHALNNASSEISQHLLTYSDNGYLIQKEFQNPYGTNKPLNNSHFGTKYSYNNKGLKAFEVYIDKNGSFTFDKSGKTNIKYQYNGMGLLEKEYSSMGGVKQYKYDKWGNQIEISYFDKNGKEVSNNGFSKEVFELNNRGEVIKNYRLTVSGEIFEGQFSIAIQQFEYDRRGRVSKIIFLNANNKPIKNKNGFAQQEFKYDNDGKIIEIKHYGEELTLEPDTVRGCSIVNIKFNANGQEIEHSCHDSTGKLTLDNEGVAKYVGTYGSNGNENSISMYGEENQPILNKEGFAKVVMKKDFKGNTISEAYYGVDDHPITITENVVRITYKFDERGNNIEQAYWGPDGKLTTIEGVAKYVEVYDDLGRPSEQYHLDIYGKPTLACDNNFYKKVISYSASKGYITGIDYFDVDNKLVLPGEVGNLNNVYPENTKNIQITSSPKRAKIFLEGKYIGITPLHTHIPQEYVNILVTKKGFKELSRVIEIKPNEKKSIHFDMNENKSQNKIDFKFINAKALEGNAEAQFELGKYFENKSLKLNGDKSVLWYKKSAENGYVAAMLALGMYYIKEHKSHQEGVYWIEKAAKAGNKVAQVEFGKLLFSGKKMQQDVKLAFKYYMLAAQQGDSRAQFLIGTIYYFGWGKKIDYKSAHKWLSLAANAGYQDSFSYLADLYNLKKWEGHSLEKALFWYKLATDFDDPHSFYRVGMAYLEGNAINRDTSQAISWLMKAYKSENQYISSQAAASLGMIYRYGFGLPSDYEKALFFDTEAVNNGIFTSANPLAFMYLQGHGIAANYQKAVYYFKLSHKHGDQRATDWLTNNGFL